VGRSLPLGPTHCPVVIKQAVYESRLYGLKRLLGASLAMKPGALLLWVPAAMFPGFSQVLHVREA